MAFGKHGLKRRLEQSEQQQHDSASTERSEETNHFDTPEAQEVTQTQTSQSPSSEASLKPLLDEIEIISLGKGKNPGGSKRWRCKHCGNLFTSSYTRVHYHSFGAPVGKKAQIQRCTVMNNRDEFQRLRKKVEEAEQHGISASLTRSTIRIKDDAFSGDRNRIAESFGMMERHSVDLKVIRALCANGIPFNVLRNPEFQDMARAINHAPKDYKLPSFDKARTTLLDECKRDVEKDLAPLQDTWYSQGISIVSDGWTNTRHQPLINVIAANSRGSMFLYAEDFSGVEKTGVAISEFLLKAIEEVGPTNVLQVVTDNASNCKAAGREIAKVHKHIFWSPCVVHTLNLIFKDFSVAFDWMNNTYNKGKEIVKYFLNHTHAHAIFRTQSNLDLLKVAKTRFASHHLLLKRLASCREALATTVVLRAWKDWVKSGDENARAIGAKVTETIADDKFWDEVENLLTITKPIFLMIKFADGEGPKMGEIYEKMDCMIGEIKDIMQNNKYASDYSRMEEIMVARWEKMNIPLHCLGFALNPHFYDVNYLQSPAPGGMPRRPPNSDKEVVKGLPKAFDKIGENESERRLLRQQMSAFQAREGIFGSVAAKDDATSMSPIAWWSTYGSQTPELADVAKKVLSQPISSSSAERIWSTYSYIHSVKRNRLNSTRADKLVFIHSNIRLQSRFTETYKKGPNRKWDINPESPYLEDSLVRLEDLRWQDDEQARGAGTSKRMRID